ncbi:MAG: hypothetical protein U9R53_08450 [Chloroflexota bacterium]|nr:hypothetical protein [Chloroflexota bacterium]
MFKHFTLRLFFLLGVPLAASLACNISQFTEWYRSDIGEDGDDHKICGDSLVLTHDYKIFCDETKSPKVHNFSGRVFNNSDQYAHNVSFEVFFDWGTPKISCPFHFDEIAPGATVEALCQFTAPECMDSITTTTNGSCEFLSYPEHLDWLAANEDKPSQDPDTEKADSFIITQAHIDQLHDEWQQTIESHPCQPDIAQGVFIAWLQGQAGTWADEAGKVIGEGKQWPTLETFGEWLMAQAKIDENTTLTKNWSNGFEMSVSALIPCQACAPPKLTGTLDLTVDLKTCQVTGKISADGEGDVTINDCVDNKPIDDTCTSHGTLTISGDISGTATKDGQLTINPTKTTFKYSTQWIEGCEWDSQEVEKSTWEDPITITGTVNWKESATGKIHWASTACSMDGDWTAYQ